jgi:hypothetical protein
MKNYIILICIFAVLFITISPSVAQKIKIELGPQIKFPSKRLNPTLLYSDETGYYLWSIEYSGLFSMKSTSYLDKLNDKFELVSSKEFLSNEDGIYNEGTRYFNGKFLWMVADRDKKNDRITYKAIPISLDGKSSKPVTLSRFKYEKKRDIPSTDWFFNIDTSNLLFIAESDNDSKKEEYQTHLVSVDKEMNTLWDRTLQFTKTESQVQLLSKELNKKGEVYLLYKIYDDKKKEKKGDKPAYSIELFYIKNDSAEIKKFKLDIKDSFIKSANLKLRDNGEMYCVGLYSNTVGGPTHGIFYMKLIDDEVVTTTRRNFSDSDLEKLGSKKTEKDKSGEEGLNDDFRFKSLVIAKDGSTFITVEPNYKLVYTYSTGRTTTTSVTFHSEDIIVIDILPDGEIAKLNILLKRQESKEGYDFISHSSFTYEDKIYLFYNEDEDNLNKPIDQKRRQTTSKYSDYVATMTTIDKNGVFERKPLFSHDDTDSILFPNEIRRVNDKKYFFMTVQRKLFTSRSKYTFGSINIESN